jgi:DNA polymerase-3 subunit delta
MLTRVSLPITLITGSEEVLVRQALDEARREARERDGADPDRRTVSAADDEAAPALAEALGPTLFDEPALVIVTDADQIDDALWAVINSAFADPPPGVSLVVTHPGGVKGKKYLTALRAAGAQEVTCAAIKKGRQTEDFLAAEVRRRGRKATPGAIHALYEAIGHDVALLLGAIAQLCSDVESGLIDEEAVARYFVGVADVQGYRVSDSVWDRRPVDALRDLRWMAESSGRAGVGPAVTAMLGTGLRSLVRVQGLPPTMSEAEARRVLADDVERFATGVRAALTREVSPQQFSALVSFAFNVGTAAFRASSVLRAVNEGDFGAVPGRLGLWVKARGKTLPGLVRRRAAEAEMFSATQTMRPRASLFALIARLLRFFMRGQEKI